MKSTSLLIFALAAMASAAAEFSFKVEATYKGKPIPSSEIKLVPFEREKVRTSLRISPSAKDEVKATKRANPTLPSVNCEPALLVMFASSSVY